MMADQPHHKDVELNRVAHLLGQLHTSISTAINENVRPALMQSCRCEQALVYSDDFVLQVAAQLLTELDRNSC